MMYFLFSRRFSESEIKDLRALFVSLGSQSRSGGEFISASVFQVLPFICFIYIIMCRNSIDTYPNCMHNICIYPYVHVCRYSLLNRICRDMDGV
mgnify:CR=1 FL=1